MRIAYFTQWWPPEVLASRLSGSLATALVDAGHELQVVTGFPNYPTGRIYDGYRLRWRQIERSAGMEVIRVPLYPSHSNSTLGRMANFASFAATSTAIGLPHIRHADVAYVYHPPMMTGTGAVLLKWLRRVPFVLHVQDMWPESVLESSLAGGGRGAQLLGRTLDGYCRAMYHAAARIVVISPGFKRLLIERGVPEDKIDVIPNWADETLYGRRTESAGADRELLGPPGTRTVLYAGNLGDFQGLDDAILAAARVGPRLQLTLVGDGIARERLVRLAESEHVCNVRFLPARSETEVVPLLHAADAHLVKLRDLEFFKTTIPGKTQVSLACGKPLVMAVRGDAADIVETADCGVACVPSVGGLTEAFGRIAGSSDDELARMGAAARSWYDANCAYRTSTTAIERVLQSVAR